MIENAEFHSSDESSDEEEAVKAGQVNLCSVLVPLISLFTGEGCLVPKWNRGGCHREESPFGG